MDELKAFVLVAAVAARLWLPDRQPALAARGPAGPDRGGLGHQPDQLRAPARIRGGHRRGASPRRRRLRRGPARRRAARERAGRPCAHGLEASGKFLVHYPSYLVFVAIFNRLDIFLHVYAAVNAAYAARAMLGDAAASWGGAARDDTAIIVAAGRGSRLGDATQEIPKCMVKVAGSRSCTTSSPRCRRPASPTSWWCAATGAISSTGGRLPACASSTTPSGRTTTSWPR